MRVVTWNVNSLKMRMPRVLEFIELHRPDVLLLQETKAPPDAFPDLELAEAGYHAVHHSAGQWAGVAVLAGTIFLIEALTGDGPSTPAASKSLGLALEGVHF